MHVEADRLEHALSEELEAKIDAELGFPTHDPHGDPIPDRELRVEPAHGRTLVDLEAGRARTGLTRSRRGRGAAPLPRRSSGLVPGAPVEMVAQAPFAGPVTLRTENGEHAISRELADRIGRTWPRPLRRSSEKSKNAASSCSRLSTPPAARNV